VTEVVCCDIEEQRIASEAASFVQDHKAEDFTSKILKALNNMKIKIPGRSQEDADCMYRQVCHCICLRFRSAKCGLTHRRSVRIIGLS